LAFGLGVEDRLVGNDGLVGAGIARGMVYGYGICEYGIGDAYPGIIYIDSALAIGLETGIDICSANPWCFGAGFRVKRITRSIGGDLSVASNSLSQSEGLAAIIALFQILISAPPSG
jgi:hypothetical protein